ncbi:DUF2752 domain-containing protein [Natronogracilivirga saccharolytica]|uniref:DUF2752 domain-containing protein n=1 Tax=Natronogracilivirga saccharolytica TaxID=2812953 RepID=A0A8J7UUD4_9BACT|nr:DUF2752 domain-containing protein [Natronogracilivirga saccharolytica]MBP3191341.1 DUF2752 domain-containing protein [Natronogracilivirga saccharolytica]
MLAGNPIYALILALALTSYAFIAWLFFRAESAGISAQICPVNRLTGFPCPSCGTSRSIVLLLNGDVAGSLLINPLGVIAAGLLIVLPAWTLSDLIRKKETLLSYYQRAEAYIGKQFWLASVLIILVLANWFWNIQKGL